MEAAQPPAAPPDSFALGVGSALTADYDASSPMLLLALVGGAGLTCTIGTLAATHAARRKQSERKRASSRDVVLNVNEVNEVTLSRESTEGSTESASHELTPTQQETPWCGAKGAAVVTEGMVSPDNVFFDPYTTLPPQCRLPPPMPLPPPVLGSMSTSSSRSSAGDDKFLQIQSVLDGSTQRDGDVRGARGPLPTLAALAATSRPGGSPSSSLTLFPLPPDGFPIPPTEDIERHLGRVRPQSRSSVHATSSRSTSSRSSLNSSRRASVARPVPLGHRAPPPARRAFSAVLLRRGPPPHESLPRVAVRNTGSLRSKSASAESIRHHSELLSHSI